MYVHSSGRGVNPSIKELKTRFRKESCYFFFGGGWGGFKNAVSMIVLSFSEGGIMRVWDPHLFMRVSHPVFEKPGITPVF